MTKRTSRTQEPSRHTVCQSLPPEGIFPRRRSPSKAPPEISPTRRSMLGVWPITLGLLTAM